MDYWSGFSEVLDGFFGGLDRISDLISSYVLGLARIIVITLALMISIIGHEFVRFVASLFGVAGVDCVGILSGFHQRHGQNSYKGEFYAGSADLTALPDATKAGGVFGLL